MSGESSEAQRGSNQSSRTWGLGGWGWGKRVPPLWSDLATQPAYHFPELFLKKNKQEAAC